MRRWPRVAARRRARRAVPGGRRARGPVRAATSPTGGSRRRTAPTLREHAPGRRGSTASAARPSWSLEDGERHHRAARSSSPPTPGPTTCSTPLGAAPAADGDPGAGHLVHAARRPARCSRRTGSRSGSGWTSRPSTASRRTASRARRSARTSAAGEVTAGDADVRARRRGARAGSRPSSRPTCRAMAVEPFRYQDLPVHADAGPRLRARRRARATRTCSSRSGRRTASSSRRVIGRIMAELALDGATPSAPRDRGVPARPAGPATAATPADLRHLSAPGPGPVARMGPPSGPGCRSRDRVPRSAALADGIGAAGEPWRSGSPVELPGGTPRDDPAIPPPDRAARRPSLAARVLRAAAGRRARRRGGPRRAHASGRPRTSTRRTRSTPRSSSGYEAFQLTYNLLTEFDKDPSPAPGLRRHVGARRPTG